MTRCPACLRVVLVTPHLTDDRKCDGVTFAGAVDFSSGEPVIVLAPVVTEHPGRSIALDPDALALVAAGAV